MFSDGASNIDGRYCVYDRIGMRASFVKANTVRAPPATRYVIVFDENNNDDDENDNKNNDNNNGKNVNLRSNNTNNSEEDNRSDQVHTLKR